MTTVTVFGGTGFLGRRITEALLARGATVRVAARHPDRGDLPATDRLQRLSADVTDAASVQAVVQGADAVANAVSLYVERRAGAFQAIHFDGAHRVAEAAARAGARLVHVSGIGSDPDARSPYIRSRGLGEETVRAVFPEAAIFRPAVMFGAGDALLTTLTDLVRRVRVLPLFGRGATRLQPIYVGDVAEAAAIALTASDPHSGVSELGGPQILTYRDLLALVMDHAGHHPRLVGTPFVAWKALAIVARQRRVPPVTEGQVALMRRDNVADPTLPGLAAFGIEPTDLATILRRDFPVVGAQPSGSRISFGPKREDRPMRSGQSARERAP